MVAMTTTGPVQGPPQSLVPSAMSYLVPLAPLALLLLAASPGEGIYCYQCNSTDLKDPYQCQEMFPDDAAIEPQSCHSVYGARYCIKHTGRFEGEGILCYQCDTPLDTACSDLLIHEPSSPLSPTSCDHIFEAFYCVKTEGLYEGGVGTRRFCSSVNMGNYCNEVSQPGDDKQYRSCVFTCDTDGCNTAASLALSSLSLVPSLLLFLSL